MTTVNDHGFYLYRNCIYDIGLKSHVKYNARLIDIKKDTLIFTNCFNENVAKMLKQRFDTLYLTPNDISQLFLIGDRIFGLHSKISLAKYNYLFKVDTSNCKFPVYRSILMEGDSIKYELVPYLTQQGIDLVYEREGKTYYFEGIMPKHKINK